MTGAPLPAGQHEDVVVSPMINSSVGPLRLCSVVDVHYVASDGRRYVCVYAIRFDYLDHHFGDPG